MATQELEQYGITANATDNKSCSREIERIHGSPFIAIKDEEKPWKLTFGKYMVTGEWETFAEVENYVNDDPWELMLDVISIMIEAEKQN